MTKPKAESKPRAGKERTPCLVCKKLFRVPPSAAARGKGHTCSAACASEIRGYGRPIRAALPGTVRGIAARTHLTESCVCEQLGNMIRAGICKVAGFERNTLKAVSGAPTLVPIIALGVSLDPDMPLDMRAAVTRYTRGLIVAAMPGRAPDIADALFMPGASVLNAIKAMSADGLCHIGAWVASKRGRPTAVYHKGAGVDAIDNVPRMTRAEICARFKKRIKGTDRLDLLRSKNRSAHWEKKAVAKANTWFGALPGANTKEGAVC